jgi:hypothetical protein
MFEMIDVAVAQVLREGSRFGRKMQATPTRTLTDIE